jgi:hypothetical protein
VLPTNAGRWRVYHVIFDKPIEHGLVAEINFLEINGRSSDDLDKP